MRQHGGQRYRPTYAQVCHDIMAASRTFCIQSICHLVHLEIARAASYKYTRLTSLSCFSLREAIYTFAPFCTYAAANMAPMPEPPPVTTAAHVLNNLPCSRERLKSTLTDFAPDVKQTGDGEIYKCDGQARFAR